jgi:hypothetical protein
MVKSDKNNVQAGDDLANSNMTMGLVLYLMHSPRQALLFERRPDSMYSDVAVQRSERSRSTPPPSPFIKLAQSRPQEEPRKQRFLSPRRQFGRLVHDCGTRR